MIRLPASQLRSILATKFPGATLIISDKDYNVPTEEAFDEFRRELAKKLFDEGRSKWAEQFDCDNFALAALDLAAWKHQLASWQIPGLAQGAAVGLLFFQQRPSDPASGHAINIRLSPDLSVVGFEPQNGRDIELTPDQCNTAWFAFFV